MVCHFLVADISDRDTPYAAISYVWGGQDTPAVIRCSNGVDNKYISFPITSNAADALKSARDSQYERLLWIDSVCIDQTCLEEKSAQVAMMDRIFANATTVLIWLGFDDEINSNAAGELFERMATCLQN